MKRGACSDKFGHNSITHARDEEHFDSLQYRTIDTVLPTTDLSV